MTPTITPLMSGYFKTITVGGKAHNIVTNRSGTGWKTFLMPSKEELASGVTRADADFKARAILKTRGDSK